MTQQALDSLMTTYEDLPAEEVRKPNIPAHVTTQEALETVQFVRQGDGTGRFSVVDTGPGIAPEHIPRLTERFYRLDRSRSRDTGGTGLGLAIVKHVLQRHGAQLQIRSTLGKGSEFVVVFPASRVRKADAEALV